MGKKGGKCYLFWAASVHSSKNVIDTICQNFNKYLIEMPQRIGTEVSCVP